MQQGFHTGKFGSELTEQLRTSAIHAGLRVFYDHGDKKNAANVTAVHGFVGASVSRLNWVTDVDILIASESNVAKVIVEIEERNCSPKKICGDVFAGLLCNKFVVKERKDKEVFGVDKTTKFIVAGIVPSHGHRLRKIKEVISTRIKQSPGFPDGIAPENVELVFEQTIEAAIQSLRRKLGYFSGLD